MRLTNFGGIYLQIGTNIIRVHQLKVNDEIRMLFDKYKIETLEDIKKEFQEGNFEVKNNILLVTHQILQQNKC